MEITHRKRSSASIVATCRVAMRYMLDHLDLPITDTEGHYLPFHYTSKWSEGRSDTLVMVWCDSEDTGEVVGVVTLRSYHTMRIKLRIRRSMVARKRVKIGRKRRQWRSILHGIGQTNASFWPKNYRLDGFLSLRSLSLIRMPFALIMPLESSLAVDVQLVQDNRFSEFTGITIGAHCDGGPTGCVTRWWAGQDQAILAEPALGHANGLKTRRLPPVGCTPC